MKNLKCPCGGNVIACVLSQNSHDYYIKRNNKKYSRPFRIQKDMPMEVTLFVCDTCQRQEDYPEDFTDEQ